MSYQLTIPLTLGTSQTGLSLEAQLVNTTGSAVGSAVTTGFVELGAGNYLWTGSIPDGHTGGIKFQLSGGGALKAGTAINPQETENPDVKTSTRNAVAPLDSAATATAMQTGLTAQGYTAPRGAKLDNLDTNIGSRSTYAGGPVASVTAAVDITQAAADKVWTSAARTLTGFGTLVADVAAAVWGAVSRTITGNVTAGTVLDKTGYSLTTAPPTLSGIVNGVLDAPLSAHTTAGTVAAGISNAGGGGGGSDPLADPYPGAYADGTYGAYLRDKLALIHVGQVVVQNPISPDGHTITIVRGDAYNAATRRLVWTLTGYPNLSGGAVKLSINGAPAITGSVMSTSSSGGDQDVAVDLTPTQSAALAGRVLPATATVLLTSGDPMTFWVGYLDARGKAAT